ncbi:MAG: DNA-processing protein DprA [Treponema sp.]|jgi:DNA processing protein|nr:DNA-processing protein DprA [Treponema sp.]
MNDRGLLDLMIIRIPGLKPVEQGELCKKFDREEELVRLSRRDLEALLKRPLKQFMAMDELRSSAEKDAKAARLWGIRWAPLVSAEYPPLLREIYDPPAVLFHRGLLPDGTKPMAAIVGTRKPHGPALRATFDIARDLGSQGISVVSGLALGIDAMAHRGNLEGGGRTYAVLGSGVDEIYPSSNRNIARRILENGGALLSEYPPGIGPQKWHFPARNRIISALVRGTLIAEAPAGSGALITARFALEQGRDLWVSAAGLSSEGVTHLVSDGAKIIRSASDILDEWGLVEHKEKDGAEAAGNETGKALAASLARQLTIEH